MAIAKNNQTRILVAGSRPLLVLISFWRFAKRYATREVLLYFYIVGSTYIHRWLKDHLFCNLLESSSIYIYSEIDSRSQISAGKLFHIIYNHLSRNTSYFGPRISNLLFNCSLHHILLFVDVNRTIVYKIQGLTKQQCNSLYPRNCSDLSGKEFCVSLNK